METFTKDLLQQFISMDQKLNLYAANGSFEIPLSVTAAKLHSPVIKRALESPLAIKDKEEKKNQSASDTVSYQSGSLHRIEVKDFDTTTVQLFIRSLQGQLEDNEIKAFNWEQVKNLLKMYHFYGVDHMFDALLPRGQQLINNTNVVDAVGFMEKYGYQQNWCDQIVANLHNLLRYYISKSSLERCHSRIPCNTSTSSVLFY